jgi:DNA polymerase
MPPKRISPSQRAQVQVIESLARAGVTHVPKSRAKKATADVSTSASTAAVSAPKSTQSADTLEIINKEVVGCQRCQQLASTRTQTVFGVGNPRARLCFFGEAPGADEDAQGIPFVGRAGQLLTKIIEACGMTRDEVYILNVLKCRPPDNRRPEPDETGNCREYFERQLAVIRPEFICCLGTTAAQALLQSEQTIGKLRNQFFDYQGAKVICTYHPSYLLRNPPAKKDVWEDMKRLLAAMGLPVPK